MRMGDEDEETSSRGMDTDKAWAGLQHLLAKAGTPVDVIGGGKPITDSTRGYDSPRLLSVAEVADVAHSMAVRARRSRVDGPGPSVSPIDPARCGRT
jgi:hypothetical protein